MTVTRSVAFPVALLALALGCPGATLDLDGASFLDRPYGDDDGVEGRAGGGHLFDQAGNAHRQHPLAHIRMSPSRSNGNLPTFARAFRPNGVVHSYGMRVGVLQKGE